MTDSKQTAPKDELWMVLEKTRAMILASPGYKAYLVKKAKEKSRGRARAPKDWLERCETESFLPGFFMPLRISKASKIEEPPRSKTPICDAIFAKRDHIPVKKPKIKKPARIYICSCDSLHQHFLYCHAPIFKIKPAIKMAA